jgi:hypothetical protein
MPSGVRRFVAGSATPTHVARGRRESKSSATEAQPASSWRRKRPLRFPGRLRPSTALYGQSDRHKPAFQKRRAKVSSGRLAWRSCPTRIRDGERHRSPKPVTSGPSPGSPVPGGRSRLRGGSGFGKADVIRGTPLAGDRDRAFLLPVHRELERRCERARRARNMSTRRLC